MQIQTNDRGFTSIVWHHGAHNRGTIRLWISIPVPNHPFCFPVLHSRITTTEKKSLVLRPGRGVVYLYRIESGYRGLASAEISSGEAEIVANWKEFHNGKLGATGETACLLINAGYGPVTIRWYRSGRRIDQKTGLHRLTSHGEVENLIDDPEICDILEEDIDTGPLPY